MAAMALWFGANPVPEPVSMHTPECRLLLSVTSRHHISQEATVSNPGLSAARAKLLTGRGRTGRHFSQIPAA
jgi:hypothetical protein